VIIGFALELLQVVRMRTGALMRLVVVLLLLAAVSGCVFRPGATRVTVVRIDPFAPALLREVEEVLKLCPPGTRGRVAQESLGPRCRLVRLHGLSVRLSTEDKVAKQLPRDDMVLEYESPHGVVWLQLAWPSGGRPSLDAAVVSDVRAVRYIWVDLD